MKNIKTYHSYDTTEGALMSISTRRIRRLTLKQALKNKDFKVNLTGSHEDGIIITADNVDYVIVINEMFDILNDTKFWHITLEGDENGDITVEGSAYVNAIRTGKGHGDAYNKCSGNGYAIREGFGSGDAVRMNDGHGDANRFGSGLGNAIHAGKGRGMAVRSGDGHGNAICIGGGSAIKEGDGHGSAIYIQDKDNYIPHYCGNALKEKGGYGDAICIRSNSQTEGSPVNGDISKGRAVSIIMT